MISTSVTVATTATALVTGVRDSGGIVQVHNNGSNTVFVGGADVTTSNGYPIPSTEYRAFPIRPGDVLYGVVAASTENVRVIRRRD